MKLGNAMKNVMIRIGIDWYSFCNFVLKAAVKYNGELAFLLILVMKHPWNVSKLLFFEAHEICLANSAFFFSFYE